MNWSSLRRGFVTVFVKEVVDNARDRRSVATALLMPLLGPGMMVLMGRFVTELQDKASTPRVPIVHHERAPELTAWLVSQGIERIEAPADVDAAVRDGSVDVAIVIPDDFDSKLRASHVVYVQVVADPSRPSSGATQSRVEGLIQQYGEQIGALRLFVRGVDPQIAHPIAIALRDVSAPRAEAAALLALLPLFLLVSCFAGGTYVAIDSTAGERERGSLEALLHSPVPSTAIVLGKMGATALYSVVAMLVCVSGFAVTTAASPISIGGVAVRVSLVDAGTMCVMLLPVVAFAAALQVFIGTLCKTFKTAQSAIQLVLMLPVLPSSLLQMLPPRLMPTFVSIPSIGQTVLLTRVMRGESVAAGDVMLATTTTLVLTAILATLAARLFGPRLIVGR